MWAPKKKKTEGHEFEAEQVPYWSRDDEFWKKLKKMGNQNTLTKPIPRSSTFIVMKFFLIPTLLQQFKPVLLLPIVVAKELFSFLLNTAYCI